MLLNVSVDLLTSLPRFPDTLFWKPAPKIKGGGDRGRYDWTIPLGLIRYCLNVLSRSSGQP